MLKQLTSTAGEMLALSGPRNPYRDGKLGVIEEGAYADILLVEGFKARAGDKIEVHRAAAGTPLLCADDPNVIAVAADVPLAGVALPVLDLDDIPAIADFIVAHCWLARECCGRGGRGGFDPATGPNVGDEAPEFEWTDLDANKLSLSSLRGKPVVIEFGSYTCPVFRRKVNDLADLRSEYGDDVQWIMIYTLEAHPTDGRVAPVNTRAGIEIPQHTSFEKRLECAKLCAEKLDLKLHVLVDGYQNKVTDAYSGRPNRGYVLDAEGKVVSKQVWIEVQATRTALDAILQRKDSDKPTRTTKPS